MVGSLTAQLRDTVPFWEVLMALFFIAIVLVFPRGHCRLADPLAALSRRASARGPDRRARQVRRAAAGETCPARVSVHVGEVTILDQLSLDFEQAGIFCVIGPNGAGKTSMFNVVSGELAAGVRRASVSAVRTSLALLPHRVSGLGVARKLQIPSVFPDLSIADNLAIALWSGRAAKLHFLIHGFGAGSARCCESCNRVIRFSPRRPQSGGTFAR